MNWSRWPCTTARGHHRSQLITSRQCEAPQYLPFRHTPLHQPTAPQNLFQRAGQGNSERIRSHVRSQTFVRSIRSQTSPHDGLPCMSDSSFSPDGTADNCQPTRDILCLCSLPSLLFNHWTVHDVFALSTPKPFLKLTATHHRVIILPAPSSHQSTSPKSHAIFLSPFSFPTPDSAEEPHLPENHKSPSRPSPPRNLPICPVPVLKSSTESVH